MFIKCSSLSINELGFWFFFICGGILLCTVIGFHTICHPGGYLYIKGEMLSSIPLIKCVNEIKTAVNKLKQFAATHKMTVSLLLESISRYHAEPQRDR